MINHCWSTYVKYITFTFVLTSKVKQRLQLGTIYPVRCQTFLFLFKTSYVSSIPLEYEEYFKFSPQTANTFQSQLLFKFLLVVLEVEPRASCVLRKCSTTKLYPQPTDISFIFILLLLLVHILKQVASFVDSMTSASIDIAIDFPSHFPVEWFSQ